MDLADSELQKLILDSINPHSAAFNRVSWRGICLVGFDYEYPQKPNQVRQDEFTAKVKAVFPQWCQMAKSRATNRGIESFEIHILYVPFGFCDDFRSAMKKSLGLSA